MLNFDVYQDGSTPLIETIGAFEDDEEERIECIQHLVKYGATAHNNREVLSHDYITLYAVNNLLFYSTV